MFGVYYKVTREGKIFTGLKDDLIEKFNNFESAKEYCSHKNMVGYLDELHSGYVVRNF